MAECTFTVEALEDLEAIYEYGHEEHGQRQAEKYQHGLHDQFDLLAVFPGMGLPIDILGHDLYDFGYGLHIIIYSRTSNDINIEFLFSGRMDWLNRLRGWSD